MTVFGVTPAGFVAERLADIVADLNARFKTEFGANVRLDPESPNGQIIGIVAEREALVWEAIEATYNAAYPFGASGISLDRLMKLVGVTRLPATKTSAAVTLTGVAGTVIPAGSLMAVADSGALFALRTQVTIGGGGTVTGTFDAQSTGPILALAGTLNQIKTPVTGWTSGTNPADGVVGANIETDAALRYRQQTLLSTTGGTSEPGLYGVLVGLSGVSEAILITNRSSLPDADGRPGHSIEAVVRGGADQAIGNALWKNGPAGIQTVGGVAVSVVDSNGDTQLVNFSRPVDDAVWIEIDITTDANFPADGLTQIRNAVLAKQAELRIGKWVFPWHIEQGIETPGIKTLVMRVGLSASPTGTGPIPIGKTHRALLDSAHIQITQLPG